MHRAVPEQPASPIGPKVHPPKLLFPKNRPDLVEDGGGGAFCESCVRETEQRTLFGWRFVPNIHEPGAGRQ
jgi:hypothetical protein